MTWGWQPRTITRIRPTVMVDGHGNTIPDPNSGEREDTDGWLFAPDTTSVEDRDGRVQAVKYAGVFYGPADVDVAAGDLIEYRGAVYRVVGAPQIWDPGTVLDVERWNG